MTHNSDLLMLIEHFRKGNISDNIIKSAVDNYSKYPLYIIKYILIKYPVRSSHIIINHIINTNERKCELMDCVLTAHSVKVCDIPFMSDFMCVDKCNCHLRDYWKCIYNGFIKAIKENPKYFLLSYNVYYSITLLIAKTDVLDQNIFSFISCITQNPKNWKTVLRFIKNTELYGSGYGDIIFKMRDKIL
jgi:hypothetical protein